MALEATANVSPVLPVKRELSSAAVCTGPESCYSVGSTTWDRPVCVCKVSSASDVHASSLADPDGTVHHEGCHVPEPPSWPAGGPVMFAYPSTVRAFGQVPLYTVQPYWPSPYNQILGHAEYPTSAGSQAVASGFAVADVAAAAQAYWQQTMIAKSLPFGELDNTWKQQTSFCSTCSEDEATSMPLSPVTEETSVTKRLGAGKVKPVKFTWQMPSADVPFRKELARAVAKWLRARGYDDRLGSRLNLVVRRMEVLLYCSAASKEQYKDCSTLGERIRGLVKYAKRPLAL